MRRASGAGPPVVLLHEYGSGILWNVLAFPLAMVLFELATKRRARGLTLAGVAAILLYIFSATPIFETAMWGRFTHSVEGLAVQADAPR